MIFRRSLVASAVFISAATLAGSLQAAAPGPLFTRVFGADVPPDASFTGGATINSGANYLGSIPVDQQAGIVASLAPPATDVGTEADYYMVINAGLTWYMRTPSGFTVWDTRVPNLVPFATKNLEATETVSISDLEALAGQDFTGQTLRVHVGYMTNTSPLVYSSAIEFTMSGPPSDTCPAGTTQRVPLEAGSKTLCELQGTYTSDLHLTSNFEYIINGPVFFGGDNVNTVTLTMDAGVKTYGLSGADFVRISRGSRIEANGSPSAPIVMTGAGEADATADTTGLWGGFVVNGNAPVNGCNPGTVLCQREAEGNAGTYGGNNPLESSGNLNYFIVKYAGFEISPGNELNGITLNGVGSGTLVDYVQVHNGSDDGFETFGGTVNARHLVLTGNDDDNIDWQTGWRGKIQHVVVITKDVGDRAIEADNNNTARDSLPRSKGIIANATFLGRASNNVGIKLRDGTAANLSNIVVKGFGAGCLDIDHGPTFAAGGTSATHLTGELTITNSFLDCNPVFTDAAEDLWSTQAWFNGQAGNSTGSSGMTGYRNSATINARPAADHSGDSFFDDVDYIGGVKDEANDWTLGWTVRDSFDSL